MLRNLLARPAPISTETMLGRDQQRLPTDCDDGWGRARPSRQIENRLFDKDEAVGYSGYSRRLALPPSAVLGQGYSTISNSLRGMGMEVASQTTAKATGGVTYELKLIRSHEELATTLNISASASISGAWGGASASYSMFRSTDFHSERSYVLLTMTVIASEEHLAAYRLTSTAVSRMNEDPRSFYTTYGDSFISHVVRGAQLLALMEFSSEDSEEHLSVAMSMSATFSAGGGSFSQTMTAASQNKKLHVRVLYAQTGGGVGRTLGFDPGAGPSAGYAIKGGVLTLTPEELLGRIREFPHEVRSSDGLDWSSVLWGYACDYLAADNSCKRLTSAMPYLSAGWTLDDLGAEKLAVDTRRNDLKVALQRPSTSTAKRDEFEQVAEHLGYVSREIDRVGQVVVAFPLTSSRVQNGGYEVSCWPGAGTFKDAPKVAIGQGFAGRLLKKLLAGALVPPRITTDLQYGQYFELQTTCKTMLGNDRTGLWTGLRYVFKGNPQLVIKVQFRGKLHNAEIPGSGSRNIDYVLLVNGAQFVPPQWHKDNVWEYDWGYARNPGLLELGPAHFAQGFTIDFLMIGEQIGIIETGKSELEVSVTTAN